MLKKEIYKSRLNVLHIAVVFFMGIGISFSQPVLPQRTLTVVATQPLQFGTFTQVGGAIGTVKVGVNGQRDHSGGIVLLGDSSLYQPAIFEIKLCQGRRVNIILPSSVQLTNGNGSEPLTLEIEPSDIDQNLSFITDNDCNFITPLRVGGKLSIPAGNHSGTYTGNFEIHFIQE